MIEFGDCEDKLKENNIIPQDEHIYSLNTNIRNSKNTNNLNEQYNIQSVYATAFDSKGNIIDTSICSDFTIKLPTILQVTNQTEYESMKEAARVDVYNKSDPFFNDVCVTFQYNNSDITLESRNELFPKEMECNSDCKYAGVDEHNYSQCKCKELPKKIASSYLKDALFYLFNIANYKLVGCYLNIFNSDLKFIYGFFVFLAQTILYFAIMITYQICFKAKILMRNKAKVIMNDCTDITVLEQNLIPSSVGIPPIDIQDDKNKSKEANLILKDNKVIEKEKKELLKLKYLKK